MHTHLLSDFLGPTTRKNGDLWEYAWINIWTDNYGKCTSSRLLSIYSGCQIILDKKKNKTASTSESLFTVPWVPQLCMRKMLPNLIWITMLAGSASHHNLDPTCAASPAKRMHNFRKKKSLYCIDIIRKESCVALMR